MAEKKSPKLKLTAESSMGHINHDSSVVFNVFDTGMWVTHCESMLIFDRKQVDRLIRFLEKNKELIKPVSE